MGACSTSVRSRVGRMRDAVVRTFSKEHLRELFTGRSFKTGGYTAAVCVAVIGICIAAVLVVEALPASLTEWDISQEQTTSISQETADYVAGLENDVTIYLIAEEGEEDERIVRLLQQYADASDRVSVVQKDPVLYPAFTSQYTSDEVTGNSLIVTCGDEYRLVDYYDIYTMSSSSYSYEFGGESAVTSALVALTTDELPVVYTLTGHGESDLPTGVASSIESANIETTELNLLASDAVPEDADAVLAYAPTSDLSTDEKDKLLAYLEQGGGLLLFTDYSAEDLPNFDDVMNAYGLEAVDGIIVEGDGSHALSGYPYYLLPDIGDHDITEGLADANAYVLVPLAHGITEIDSYRSSLTITPLLSTSTSAYVKADAYNAETLAKEDGDVSGSTMVGAAVTEAVGDEEETRVVWFSSSQFLDTSLDKQVGGNNSKLVVNALAWLADAEDAATIAVASKGLGTTMITIDSSSASVVSAFVVGVVPLFFLICGFVVWRSRRRL